MSSVRRPASRTTAKASGRRSSSGVAPGEPLPELVRLGTELVVGEGPDLRFEGVDGRHDRAETLQLALVLGADDLGEELVEYQCEE